jgi:hypothetical protein
MYKAAGFYPFYYSDETPGTLIKATDVTDLRASVNFVRSKMGMPPVTFTDPTITPQSSIVRAIHLMELRAGTQ